MELAAFGNRDGSLAAKRARRLEGPRVTVSGSSSTLAPAATTVTGDTPRTAGDGSPNAAAVAPRKGFVVPLITPWASENPSLKKVPKEVTVPAAAVAVGNGCPATCT